MSKARRLSYLSAILVVAAIHTAARAGDYGVTSMVESEWSVDYVELDDSDDSVLCAYGECAACRENCDMGPYGTCDDGGCVLPELLLGCFCPTDHCFDDFISPMTNPVYFEDPRQLTELRGIFIHHNVPAAAGGGDVQVYALQIRARLNDRLSLIATKDGFIVSDNPLIDDGWADVALGLKYTLLEDHSTYTIISTGAVYNMPVGTPRALQAQGDGEFHLFLSGGTKLTDNSHFLTSFGGILPVDQGANSTFIYWSSHFDYKFARKWYALAELNWYHWTDDGDDRLGVTGVEGGDLFNLGSGGVEGNNIVTAAFGVKYKPNRLTEIGIAWENPIGDREDVLDNRLTCDLIFRY